MTSAITAPPSGITYTTNGRSEVTLDFQHMSAPQIDALMELYRSASATSGVTFDSRARFASLLRLQYAGGVERVIHTSGLTLVIRLNGAIWPNPYRFCGVLANYLKEAGVLLTQKVETPQPPSCTC